MQKRMLVQAILIILPATLLAQSSTPGHASTRNSVTVSGTTSLDGKTLVADKDGAMWSVSNPQALQGMTGRHVVTKCLVAGQDHVLEVISAKPVKSETRYAVNLGDAAFRR
jgi:hypothetical protein